MGRVRGWLLVVVLCCAAGVAHGEAPPDARLREAQTAFDEVTTLWDAGRYDDAIARGEHALALREAVLGGTHPDVARCLVLLGAHHLLRGNPVRAEPLLQRALAIQEATLGPNHPEVARTLTHLAASTNALPFSGVIRTCQAAPRACARHSGSGFRRDSSPRRRVAQPPRPALPAQGCRWCRAAPPARAGHSGSHPRPSPPGHRSNARRPRPRHVEAEVVRSCRASPSTGARPSGSGLWQAPSPRRRRALRILAELYQCKDCPLVPSRSITRALAIREAALGKNPPDVVRLALVSSRGPTCSRGAFARAEQFYERALAIQEAALGKSHLLVADTL